MTLTCSFDLSDQLIAESVEANMECFSCGAHERARTFTAVEYLFSTGDSFEYFECKKCNSLQIAQIPSELSRHYPADYYSMAEGAPIEVLSGFRRFVRTARTNYLINHTNFLGWAINKVATDYLRIDWEWFSGYVSAASRILDVGCGHGELLRKMHGQGFCNLTGIDPFIRRPFAVDGLRIIRGELADLHERFDFVMLHHSLEHMTDPLAALREVRRLLETGGRLLVRIPVAGNYPQRHYGINWLGLDPPRHLFIPSRTGFGELARRAGFRVDRCWYDTTAWGLLMSEAVARGIPIYDRKQKAFIGARHFSAMEVEEACKRAAALNKSEDGDTACFVLRIG